MSARAFCRLARSRYPEVADVTTPASNPMITTPIITSIREKARERSRIAYVPELNSLNRISSLQNRKNRRHHDEQHEDRQQDYQQRFEDRRQALGSGVDLLVVCG